MATSGGNVETDAKCAIVYIDGLNLHGVALKGRNPAYKWADLRKLAQTVAPESIWSSTSAQICTNEPPKNRARWFVNGTT